MRIEIQGAWDAIEPTLERAQPSADADGPDVWLVGEPAGEPMQRALAALSARGLRAGVSCDATPIDAVLAARLATTARWLEVEVRGLSDREHLRGAVLGARAAARAGLRIALALRLGPNDLREASSAGALARGLGARRVRLLDARPDAPDAVRSELLLAALSDPSLGGATRIEGFELVGPPASEPRAIDVALVTLARAGARLPLAERGTRATRGGRAVPGLGAAVTLSGDIAELGELLAARGQRALDLPRCMGGLGRAEDGARGEACGACVVRHGCAGLPRALSASLAPRPWWRGAGAGARFVVITDGPRDPVLTRALEALVRELRGLGCEARLSSPPAGESSEEREARLGRAREADRVLVLDLAVAADVLHARGLRDDAQMIVADFHLLHRLDAWHAHAGRAWPDARVQITSAFPSYAHLYLNAGIPLSAVRFRPYPVLAAAPEPQASYALSAGGHLRDVACLERAAELVAASTSTIRVYHTEASRPRRVGVLDPRGSVPLERLERELAASRFVVLPLVSDRTHANGGTLIAMAHAAGRALVTTAAPCAVDHVRDGEDAILVRPGDARALAEAIERVDRDDALRETLQAGARRAAERASVRAWASELVQGAPPGDAPRAFA